MRAHLSKSFDLGKMMMFPGLGLWSIKIGSEEIVEELKVKVYCSCRKQQDRRKMAQCIKCNDWFHQNCENIVDAVFRKRAPFTCSSCKSN